MGRVNIEDSVASDPRIDLLAKALRFPRKRGRKMAIGCMWAIWVQCVDRETDELRLEEVALALECRPADVIPALCDAADLAEDLGDGYLRIKGCEGRTDYRGRLRESAGDGGRARAEKADRDDSGRFQPRDYAADVMAAVVGGAKTRADIHVAVKGRRQSILHALRALLDAGSIIHTDHGLVPAESVPVPTVPASAVPAQSSAPSPVPALSPSPVPALSPVTEPGNGNQRETGEREPEPERCEGTERDAEPERREPPRTRLLQLVSPLPSGSLRDEIAAELWDLQEELRQRVLPGAPARRCNPFPGGSLDPIKLALGQYSPAELVRLLDVREAEAVELREQGDDPLRYLNAAMWKPGAIDHGLGTTAEMMRRRGQHKRSRQKDSRIGYANPAADESEYLDTGGMRTV